MKITTNFYNYFKTKLYFLSLYKLYNNLYKLSFINTFIYYIVVIRYLRFDITKLLLRLSDISLFFLEQNCRYFIRDVGIKKIIFNQLIKL